MGGEAGRLRGEQLRRVAAAVDRRRALAFELGSEQLPTSVYSVKRDLGLRSRIREWQAERACRPMLERTQSTAARIRHPFQGKGVGQGRFAFSVMPPELVLFMLRFYRVKPGALYVDPFAGQGVRLQVAALAGVGYHGQDTSAAFVRWIHLSLYPRLRSQGVRTQATVLLQDSRKIECETASADFCFTSPPYWSLEQYPEPLEGALDRAETYPAFLRGMEEVGHELLRVLKPGAFLVINVADIRSGGHFLPYHADLLVRLVALGFTPWDTWVLQMGGGSSIARVFGCRAVERFQAPKVHEFGLVLRRP